VPSFDVVSQVDMQEIDNALIRRVRRSSSATTSRTRRPRSPDKDGFLINSSDDKVKAAFDILQSKLVRRNVSLKAMLPGKIEPPPAVAPPADQDPAGHRQRQGARHRQDDQDQQKVQSAIQGDQVRISGKKRDDLQAAIALLRAEDFGLPIQFINFRD
jgi:uncharacterized protein YajQ (UPF0234 family)